MIENFVQATEKFISDLKDSGEFVSADEEEVMTVKLKMIETDTSVQSTSFSTTTI